MLHLKHTLNELILHTYELILHTCYVIKTLLYT